jgi:protein phosphatase/serine/threonine-protein phosphatase Stp1
MSHLAFRSFAATHPGARRTLNEDSYVDRPALGPTLGLWAVADGAGGHEAGEVAASMIAETLGALAPGLPAASLLEQAASRIAAIHHALRAEAARRGPRAVIAATLVLLLASGDRFTCLWAGDARAYRLRAGSLAQLTTDHVPGDHVPGDHVPGDHVPGDHVPGDHGPSRSSSAAPPVTRPPVTRAVGADLDDFALESTGGALAAGDRFLLCSDGVSKCLEPSELAALLGAPQGVSPTELLLAAALAREASDNITAVVIDVVIDALPVD